MTFPTEWKIIKFHGSKPLTSQSFQENKTHFSSHGHFRQGGISFQRTWFAHWHLTPLPLSSPASLKKKQVQGGPSEIGKLLCNSPNYGALVENMQSAIILWDGFITKFQLELSFVHMYSVQPVFRSAVWANCSKIRNRQFWGSPNPNHHGEVEKWGSCHLSRSSWHISGYFFQYFTNLKRAAILGWFPLLTMIPEFGRTGFGRDEIYPDIWSHQVFNQPVFHQPFIVHFAKQSQTFRQRIQKGMQPLREFSPLWLRQCVTTLLQSDHAILGNSSRTLYD